MSRNMRKVESDARNERIEMVMMAEPELTNNQLQERFGCSKAVLTRIRKKCNIERPDSFELIKRKDAINAARKIGLVKTREENIADFKKQIDYRIKTSMRERENGHDYRRDDA
ncbi:MAG: hypothetical protein ACTSW7_03760 [Candidatus Thorarchaeota archaeon]